MRKELTIYHKYGIRAKLTSDQINPMPKIDLFFAGQIFFYKLFHHFLIMLGWWLTIEAYCVLNGFIQIVVDFVWYFSINFA